MLQKRKFQSLTVIALICWLCFFLPDVKAQTIIETDSTLTIKDNSNADMVIGEHRRIPDFEIRNGIKIIKNTHDWNWKYFPELKTEVIFLGSRDTLWGTTTRMNAHPTTGWDTVAVYYMNYEEYYNKFLLCEPNPESILKIDTTNHIGIGDPNDYKKPLDIYRGQGKK